MLGTGRGYDLRFLITGANGFVGASLCAELARRDMSARAAVRSIETRLDGVELTIVGEITGNTAWKTALSNVDIVIHLAARVHVMNENSADPLEEFRKVNVSGTERLARCAATAGVKRLVYVSSIKVNGEMTCEGGKFSEMDLPSPQDPYGVSKWETEQVLHRVALETGLEVVIVRPPLVYGAGVKGNFAQMLKILAKRIPLPFSSVDNRRSLIYVENLVDVLILCATHPAAAGETFLVSDAEDVSTSDLLRRLGFALGYPARLIPVPVVLLHAGGALLGKRDMAQRLCGSLQVDISKVRRLLGWNPPLRLDEGLRRTAQGYLNEETV